MENTATRTGTSTFTDARARYVMDKIEDDFWAIRSRQFTNVDLNWLGRACEDIRYVAEKNQLAIAEVQFFSGDRKWIIRYELNNEGKIARDEESGCLKLFDIAKDATAKVVIDRKIITEATDKYLEKRGWGNNGVFHGEDGNEDRAFSKEGYGATRKLTGL